jgi:non-heme chloroperoxidase
MRCIGFDRRGHGRSDCLPRGYDYNTLADDIADMIAALDLSGLSLVGHSMGAAEIVRYLTRHGSSWITGIVLTAPVLPFIRKTEDNPVGVPEEALETLRVAWKADFPKWVVGNTPPFFAPSTSPELMRWASNMMRKTPVPRGYPVQPHHRRHRLLCRIAPHRRAHASHPWRSRCLGGLSATLAA